MEVKFRCSNCLNKIVDDGESLGEVANCPACGHELSVPYPEYGRGYEIDGFVIEQWLGNGSMGEVHLARQVSVDRPVAIKIVTTDKFEEDDDIKRYDREVKTLAKLNHPSIVSAISCGEFEGGCYLAMSYVDGLIAEDWIKKLGTIPEKDVIHYAVQIVDALEYSWKEFHILHRDLKPANIMIDNYTKVHLMDMGIAKSMDSDANLTSTGIVLGTPYYMSPEQTAGRKMDFRSDVYSLGATLYHMLVGEPPFEGLSSIQIMMQKLDTLPPSPKTLNDEVSIGMSNLVMNLMAVKPEKRPHSWEEVRKKLLNLKKGRKKKYIHVSGDSGKLKSPKGKHKKRESPKKYKQKSNIPLLVTVVVVFVIAVTVMIIKV